MEQFISTSSGLLGILNVTYTSVKGLCEFIVSIRDSDDSIRDITTNLTEIGHLLTSLETEIQTHNAKYPAHTRHALASLGNVLRSCQASCDEFKTELVGNMSPSADGTMRFWDKVKLNFHQTEVDSFKEMLVQRKGAISSLLGIANL